MVILRGFLSSLLDMPKEEITDVQIRNPVDLRKVKGKEVILDVKVEVNHEAFIDIELQMYYDRDWKKRSILYLSRTSIFTLQRKKTAYPEGTGGRECSWRKAGKRCVMLRQATNHYRRRRNQWR